MIIDVHQILLLNKNNNDVHQEMIANLCTA